MRWAVVVPLADLAALQRVAWGSGITRRRWSIMGVLAFCGSCGDVSTTRCDVLYFFPLMGLQAPLSARLLLSRCGLIERSFSLPRSSVSCVSHGTFEGQNIIINNMLYRMARRRIIARREPDRERVSCFLLALHTLDFSAETVAPKTNLCVSRGGGVSSFLLALNTRKVFV